MREHLSGQFTPGSSILHRLDARAKFFGFLLLIAATVCTNSWLGYALLLAVTAVASLCLGRYSLTGCLRPAAAHRARVRCAHGLVFPAHLCDERPVFRHGRRHLALVDPHAVRARHRTGRAGDGAAGAHSRDEQRAHMYDAAARDHRRDPDAAQPAAARAAAGRGHRHDSVRRRAVYPDAARGDRHHPQGADCARRAL